MSKFNTKTKIASLGIAVGLIATAGGALAWWTNSGNGTAGAQSAESGPVVSSSNTGGDLVPGESSDIVVSVYNPLAQPIIVTQFRAGTSQAFTHPTYSGPYSADCPAGAVTTLETVAEASGMLQTDDVTREIPATSSALFTITATMDDPPRDANETTDAANNRDACRDSPFTIDLDFEWESVAP